MLSRAYQSLSPERRALTLDIGLLVLRLAVGLTMAFAHGLGKVQKLFGEGPIKWADPLGLGPGLSLALAGGAEFFGALLVAVGLFTRAAAVPLAFTMLVAVFIVHGDDPFKKQELGLIYLCGYVALVLTGPGRLSLDELLAKRLGGR